MTLYCNAVVHFGTASIDGTKELVRFDTSGNVLASAGNFQPAIAATSSGDAVTMDNSLNIIGVMASLPTQTWTGNSYQLGSVELKVAAELAVAFTKWVIRNGNLASFTGIDVRTATTVITRALQEAGTGTDCWFLEPCDNPATCKTVDSCTSDMGPPTCSAAGLVKESLPTCFSAYITPFVVWRIGFGLSHGPWQCSRHHVSVPDFGNYPGNCTKLPD